MHEVARMTLWAFVIASATLGAQMTNDATGSLTMNGVTGQSPLTCVIVPGGNLTIEVRGNPNVPYVLAYAPTVAINTTVYAPGVALDIGPDTNVVILMNGADSPAANFWNAFANTGPSGISTLSFPVTPAAIPGQLIGGFQAFLIDFSLPGFVKPTAATALVVHDPVPDVLFTARQNTTTDDDLRMVRPPAAVEFPNSIAPFQIADIALARYGRMYGNADVQLSANPNAETSPGDFFRRVPPTAQEPRFDADNGLSPRIHTIHGDIFRYTDFATGGTGFMKVVGTELTAIPGTLRPPLPGGASAWQREVNFDDEVMLAVEDSATGNDRLWLIRIDGTNWPQTGTPMLDASPTQAPLPQTIWGFSMAVMNGVAYFTGDSSSSSRHICRLPTNGTAAAVEVILPLISAGNPVGNLGRDIFVDAAHGNLWIGVLTFSGNFHAIQRISNITPAGGETVTTITNSSVLPTNVQLYEFGRAKNGRDGNFAVSPNGNRIAFIVRDTNGNDELRFFDVLTTANIFVSSSARFAATLSEIVDVDFLDDQRLVFWIGNTAQQMDLYAFDLTNGLLVNLTQTNGQSGAVLPISGSPPALNDPTGQIVFPDRMVFRRGCIATSGTFTGVTMRNFGGIETATLMPYNITGDQLPGASTTHIASILPRILPCASSQGTTIWFGGRLPSANLSQLYSWDIAGPHAPATSHIASFPNANSQISHVVPSLDGSTCLTTQTFVNVNGGDRIIEAFADGSPFIVRIPESGTIDYHEILRFPPGSGHDGFFVRQNGPIANITTQRENRLLLHDLVTGQTTSIAGQVGLNATDFTFHFLAAVLP